LGWGGTTVVTVSASDLDGNSVTQAISVAVESVFTDWGESYSLQGSEALPGSDVDGDLLVNAAEFVLMGSPVVADANTVEPRGSLTQVAQQSFASLTFKLRKDLGGAGVVMEASATLSAGGWSPVWTSADPDSAQVTQRVDQGDYWLITVRDSLPLSPGASQKFLRLLIHTGL